MPPAELRRAERIREEDEQYAQRSRESENKEI